MKRLVQLLSIVLISFNIFGMEEPSKLPLRPGVYLTEIDNQTDEHMRISTCRIEPTFKYEQLSGFSIKMDDNKNPIINEVLKTVCPGKKITQ